MTWRVLLGVFLWLGLVATGHPASAREEILSFVSDIKVERDGALNVTETIKVRAERQQIRRGIYRDFPTRLIRDDGLYQKMGFEVVEVLKNGSPEPYHLEWQGFGTRVYIGSENVIIPKGLYTYTIRYRTKRQLRFFAEHDELYWNVTGISGPFRLPALNPGCAFPTERVSVNSMPLPEDWGRMGVISPSFRRAATDLSFARPGRSRRVRA